MREIPVILSIAGSDSSGGAGIQADIKTISALGGYAATAITSITAQNTLGVKEVYPLPPAIVEQQIKAVMDDLKPEAIKIGMLSNPETIQVVAHVLQSTLCSPLPIVYDPVMVSSSGHLLMSKDTVDTVRQKLFPLVTLLTPNLNEAEALTGRKVSTLEEMQEAARELTDRYHFAVLLKGGHLASGEMSDVLHTTDYTYYIYREQKIETRNLHGTGCTLSSAIAAFLAQGCNLPSAIEKAKNYITRAILTGKTLNIGEGNGPLWHFPDTVALK